MTAPHPRSCRAPTSVSTRYVPAHRLRPPAGAVIRRRFRVREHHRAVPRQGPVILAANHIGVIDGPLLAIFGRDPCTP